MTHPDDATEPTVELGNHVIHSCAHRTSQLHCGNRRAKHYHRFVMVVFAISRKSIPSVGLVPVINYRRFIRLVSLCTFFIHDLRLSER